MLGRKDIRNDSARSTAAHASTPSGKASARTQASSRAARTGQTGQAGQAGQTGRTPSVRTTRSRSRMARPSASGAVTPSATTSASSQAQEPELVSTSVGELRRRERAERLRRSSRRYLMKIIAIIGAIVVVLAGWAAVYNSPLFTIENVQVNGVEHLTSEEMSQLASVPTDSTLLRVDTEAVASRVKQCSWVQDVKVNRAFPDTLEINVTERTVEAVVEMPNESGTATKRWAIASDRVWLMPIPDADSEAAQTTSSKIYEDAQSVVHIVDLPFGTQAEIGQECADAVVNNALDILQEMTTELADQVVKISAASTAETSLYLENGMEIAFGEAADIRDKERTILKIMEDNPDGVAYINVRMVENPTWRSI